MKEQQVIFLRRVPAGKSAQLRKCVNARKTYWPATVHRINTDCWVDYGNLCWMVDFRWLNCCPHRKNEPLWDRRTPYNCPGPEVWANLLNKWLQSFKEGLLSILPPRHSLKSLCIIWFPGLLRQVHIVLRMLQGDTWKIYIRDNLCVAKASFGIKGVEMLDWNDATTEETIGVLDCSIQSVNDTKSVRNKSFSSFLVLRMQRMWGLHLETILLEIDISDSSLEKTYVYGNSQILSQHTGGTGASRYFYLHDRLGSVSQVIDTSGVVQANYTYKPFGQILDAYATVDNAFMFTGQYYDAGVN